MEKKQEKSDVEDPIIIIVEEDVDELNESGTQNGNVQNSPKNVESNMFSNKTSEFQCNLCSYKAKQKYLLKRHNVMHEDIPENEMIKCGKCSYMSKRRSDMREHMEAHENVNEADMFKCEECSYMTKRKKCLRQHILTQHRERELFQCDMCPYKSNVRYRLNQHQMRHRDVFFEEEVFRCAECSYLTIRKATLKLHIRNQHRQWPRFPCSLCPYKAKVKARLKQHELIHKNIDEVTLFRCAECSYKSKKKSELKQHIFCKHKKKSVSECDQCSYSTKIKFPREFHFKEHEVMHGEGIKMEKHVSVEKSDLKLNEEEEFSYIVLQNDIEETEIQHAEKEFDSETDKNEVHNENETQIGDVKVSGENDEVDIFECEQCSYVSVERSDFKRHLGNHHRERPVFQCYFCSFKTRIMFYLREHEISHKQEKQPTFMSLSNVVKQTEMEDIDEELNSKVYMKQKETEVETPNENVQILSQEEEPEHQISHREEKQCPFMSLSNEVEETEMQEIKEEPNSEDYQEEPENEVVLLNENDGVQSFKCEKCSYVTSRKSDLKLHILCDHLEGPVFQCDSCSYKTEMKFRLKQHYLTHLDLGEDEMLKCEECPYMSKRKSDLNRHILIRHKEGPMLQCELCPYKAKVKFRLKEHMLIHADLDEAGMFKCKECPYTTKRRFCLKQHILTRHRDGPLFHCDICPYKCKIKDRLQKHKMRHRDIFSGEEVFKCGKCSYATIRKGDLNRHISRNHSEEPMFQFKCDKCSFMTTRKSSLNRHISGSHLEGLMFRCEFCPYKTQIKVRLEEHETTHQRVFQCQLCSYNTRRKEHLEFHQLVHNEDSE